MTELSLENNTATETYVETTRYRLAVKALAALTPCPWTGKIDEDTIKTILGEDGGIWPMSIRGDVEAVS